MPPAIAMLVRYFRVCINACGNCLTWDMCVYVAKTLVDPFIKSTEIFSLQPSALWLLFPGSQDATKFVLEGRNVREIHLTWTWKNIRHFFVVVDGSTIESQNGERTVPVSYYGLAFECVHFGTEDCIGGCTAHSVCRSCRDYSLPGSIVQQNSPAKDG